MLTLKGLELVTYQDKLYYLYRRVDKSLIKEGFVNDVRDAWHCDIVLKKKSEDDETLMFLVEISDAIIVEDSEATEKN